MLNDNMPQYGKKGKQVRFENEPTIYHTPTLYSSSGKPKPKRADEHRHNCIYVDIKEKRRVKEYLENYHETYKGLTLKQYINNQDGTYTLKFVEPPSLDEDQTQIRSEFSQSFMQEAINEITLMMDKLEVKGFLENENRYKGYILTHYQNNQDDTFKLIFEDPASGQKYPQTFAKAEIDNILKSVRKSKKQYKLL